jgi:hypothetical protein
MLAASSKKTSALTSIGDLVPTSGACWLEQRQGSNLAALKESRGQRVGGNQQLRDEAPIMRGFPL